LIWKFALKPALVVGFNKKSATFDRALCDPDWIQTNDLLLRRQLLYSTELPDRRSAKILQKQEKFAADSLLIPLVNFLVFQGS
jgi:hypothetical protein